MRQWSECFPSFFKDLSKDPCMPVCLYTYCVCVCVCVRVVHKSSEYRCFSYFPVNLFFSMRIPIPLIFFFEGWLQYFHLVEGWALISVSLLFLSVSQHLRTCWPRLMTPARTSQRWWSRSTAPFPLAAVSRSGRDTPAMSRVLSLPPPHATLRLPWFDNKSQC